MHVPQGAVRLADLGVIRATGEEARKFLHGQLTQDVEHLEAGRARLAGYCSAKGRLLATFVVWRHAPDELFLACSADVLPAVLKRLSMFVLRARCKLSDISAVLPLWGLAGGAARQALGDAAPAEVWGRTATGGGDVVRLPDGLHEGARIERFLFAGEVPPVLATMDPGAWLWLEATSGVARVVGATVEQFVPQMVNLDLVGGVNFQKGCYPGQEVVARSQYRGTLKRRGYVVSSPLALAPGQEVFHDADPGQPAGMVVLAGTLGADQHAALVELKIAALHGGSLRVGSADGVRLTPTALPYPIPAEPD
jgi:folate-binding protein YgfZ